MCAPLPPLSPSHTHTETYTATRAAVPFTFMAMHSVCKWTLLWFWVSDMSKCVLQLFVCLAVAAALLLLLRDRAAILAAHFDKWPTGSALSPLPKAAPAMATATVTPFCEDFKQAWA